MSVHRVWQRLLLCIGAHASQSSLQSRFLDMDEPAARGIPVKASTTHCVHLKGEGGEIPKSKTRLKITSCGWMDHQSIGVQVDLMGIHNDGNTCLRTL